MVSCECFHAKMEREKALTSYCIEEEVDVDDVLVKVRELEPGAGIWS